MSADTRADIGLVADLMQDWVGGRTVLVLSNHDLLPATPLDKKIQAARKLVYPFLVNSIQQPGFIARQFNHLAQKFPEIKLFDLISAGGYSHETVLNKVMQGEACVFAESTYPYGHEVCIIAPPPRITLRTLFHLNTAIPESALENVSGTAEETAFYIMAHECAHTTFVPDDLADIRLNRHISEAQADRIACNLYNTELERGRIRTPGLPQTILGMRAIAGVLAPDFSHAAGLYLDQDPLPLPNAKSSERARIAYEDFTNLLKSEEIQNYRTLYRKVSELNKKDAFSACPYQKKYATQFLNAIERHAPCYTR